MNNIKNVKNLYISHTLNKHILTRTHERTRTHIHTHTHTHIYIYIYTYHKYGKFLFHNECVLCLCMQVSGVGYDMTGSIRCGGEDVDPSSHPALNKVVEVKSSYTLQAFAFILFHQSDCFSNQI